MNLLANLRALAVRAGLQSGAVAQMNITQIFEAAAALGDVSVAWKGAWSSATDYVANDIVSYSGSSYICKLARSHVATTPPNDATHWDLVATKGTDGTNGTNGTNGIGILASGIATLDANGLATITQAAYRNDGNGHTTTPVLLSFVDGVGSGRLYIDNTNDAASFRIHSSTDAGDSGCFVAWLLVAAS